MREYTYLNSVKRSRLTIGSALLAAPIKMPLSAKKTENYMHKQLIYCRYNRFHSGDGCLRQLRKHREFISSMTNACKSIDAVLQFVHKQGNSQKLQMLLRAQKPRVTNLEREETLCTLKRIP